MNGNILPIPAIRQDNGANAAMVSVCNNAIGNSNTNGTASIQSRILRLSSFCNFVTYPKFESQRGNYVGQIGKMSSLPSVAGIKLPLSAAELSRQRMAAERRLPVSPPRPIKS